MSTVVSNFSNATGYFAQLQLGVSNDSNIIETRTTFSKSRVVYRIFLQTDEDGRFVATSPDLQGVVTDGKNKDEAIKNAIEAVEAILESMKVEKNFILQIIQKQSSV